MSEHTVLSMLSSVVTLVHIVSYISIHALPEFAKRSQKVSKKVKEGVGLMFLSVVVFCIGVHFQRYKLQENN